jgi:hypothetical protein
MVFDAQPWQLGALSLVTLLSVGWMGIAIARLSSRRATSSAVLRQATDVESALVGGVVPDGARVFDGWSYRVGARFAGRVRVAVYPDRVSVAGPRIPRWLYDVWIWVQGLMLSLAIPAAVAAAVMLDWRWLLVALGVFAGSFAISMGGAGLWPGLGELFVDRLGHFKALEFPSDSVREIDIGSGWSKGGLGVVLFPYKAGVDKMSEGRAVSFFAPDEFGREVRFAIDVFTEDRARELRALLTSGFA